MKSLSIILFLALIAAAPTAGQARAAPAYSPAYDRCLKSGEAAKGVTVAMAGCANAELARQDVRLNAAYATAMKRLAPKDQAALRTAQRAWIKRRDADCAEGLSGGTIDMIERASCHLQMTAVRAGELESGTPTPKPTAAMSEARAFAHGAGVVDVLVIGPAAQTLYERLPGQGMRSACGAAGLHKGQDSMTCAKDGGDYSCHIWLDAGRRALAPPENDEC